MTVAADRKPIRLREGLALLLLLCCGACASHWTVRTANGSIPLQWPYPPNPPKVTYLRSLTGFSVSKGARSVLRAIVYGRNKGDRNGFILPVAVATGADGRIAVADPGAGCVHWYDPARQRYLRLTGPGGGRILSPVAVAFDDASRLWVSDSAGRVLAFGPEAEFLFELRSAGAEPLQRPTGLAYSPARKLLYVVDTLAGKVHAFDARGEFAFSFGQRGEGEGSFNFPTHITRSPAGELYVTDALNFRIAIFDESGRPLGSFGHHGDGSGDLAMPKGIAVDRDGTVYVVDSLFDNVQLFDRQGTFLLTLGRRGVDSGEFWLPSGAFLDGQGKLYVCDSYNRRIQVFLVSEQYAQPAS